MRSWLLILFVSVGVPSCAKPVVFKGQSTIAVAGTPPAPPPEPAKPSPRVEVRDNKIEIRDKIQFDHDKATIKEASFGLMAEIAAVITKNPHIKRIQIEGHASAEGSASHNKKLSEARAKSVMQWLTSHGIVTSRLTAIGFGIDRPLGDNNTDQGREQNRRVEFTIVEQDVTKRKVEVDASGAEKVLEESSETISPASTTQSPAAMNHQTNQASQDGRAKQ
jgi:outer membrane protein OmpA-like peptidoglycan-associated protein